MRPPSPANPPEPSAHDNLRLERQLCFALYAATHAMTRSYKRALAPLGLTYPQYLVMLVLWERDGLGISDIAGALDLDAATVTPLVKRLETAGWVARQRLAEDERVVQVTVRPAGWAMRAQVADIQTAVACSTGLSGADFAQLQTALRTLSTRLHQGRDRLG